MMLVEAIRNGLGWMGERIIYSLIWVCGRKCDVNTHSWLDGPCGNAYIGVKPYEETAKREDLSLVRNAGEGGLIPDFDLLRSPDFDPSQVDQEIRDFYEGTAGFKLDTWATTYFPANIALWLLVQTISRRVDQLNFPLDGLDAARGMTSEVVLLQYPDGAVKYTGWYRKLRSTNKPIYTGFYTTETLPELGYAVIKTIFPMPNGNSTVFLRPENSENGGLRLVSVGSKFGDVGFYRIQRRKRGTWVWRVSQLHEIFDLYRDENEIRCDHRISFLGFKVLALHYRIQGKPARLKGA